MSIVGIRKILLAGTALVAVSAFSAQAQATTPLATVGVTTAESSAIGPGSAIAAAVAPAAGAAGISLSAGSTAGTPLTLTLDAGATVTGQTGGTVTATGDTPSTGGIGIDFNTQTGVATAPLSLVNTAGGTGITGGAGGAAFQAGAAASATTAGANGAAGVNSAGTYVSVTGTSEINGGTGGEGSSGNTAAGGTGGAGGDAVDFSGSHALLGSATTGYTGVITGGIGGNGGDSAFANAAGVGGAGGNGGIGINLESGSDNATINVAADVSGGQGGSNGTASGTGAGTALAGGIGGIGINAVGNTETITITGATTTVAGGAGGSSAAGSGTAIATGSAGGIGLNVATGTGDIITNAGIIVGGVGGSGTAAGLSGVAVNIGSSVASLTNTGTIGNASTETSSALVLGAAIGESGATGAVAFNNTGGTITNNATTLGNATLVINTDQVYTLTNAGTISNVNVAGVAVNIAHTQTSAFVNTGTINATSTGTAVSFGAANLAFTNSGTVTGNIADTGGTTGGTVTNSGAITGNLSFTGSENDTVINSGAISGGLSSTGSGNDSVTLNAGTDSNIAGNISLTGSGADTVNLNGGGAGGTITLGAGANVINVTGDFTTHGDITSSGSIALTSETDGILNVANAITTGTGAVSAIDNGIINVDTGGSIGTSGAVSTSGTGALNLVGGNVTSTGALTNNGSVNIYAGSTLSAATQTAGTGTFNFSVSSSGSTVSAGQLALTGAGSGLTMAGSTIRASVGTGSGAIASGSVIEIASGTAAVVSGPVGSTSPAQSTAVAVTSGTDLYTFQYAFSTNATVMADTAITPSADDIYLIVTKNNLITQSSITNNDLSVNNALSTFGNEGATTTAGETVLNNIILKIGNETTAAAIHNDLQSLTPTVDGGSEIAALNVVAETQDIADNRMTALREGDPLSGVAAGATADGISMWYEGYGQHANQDAMDNINGYSSTTWGGAVGADSGLMEDGGIYGVAFNYGHSAINSDNANTTLTDLGNYGINTYATIHFGPTVFLNGQLGYAYNTVDSYRHNADLVGDTADGSTHSNEYSAKMDMGRDYAAGGTMINNNWALDPVTLTPDASLAYTYLGTKGYTESGAGGADLTVNGNSQNVLALGIGGTMAWKIRYDDGSALKPSLHAGYAYDAVDSTVQTVSSFVGDPANTVFATTGASPSRNIFDVGAKAVYMSMADWDFSANYDFQIKQDYTSNTGELRATTHF